MWKNVRSRTISAIVHAPAIHGGRHISGQRFIDIFAGCGGLAYGFVSAGFTHAGAVEVDALAAETYKANVDDAVLIAEISTVRVWPKAEVLLGGPPCQGFSQLGSRSGADPRNGLWREYVRALDGTQAVVFVMENVPQLLKSRQFAMFTREVGARGFQLAELHVLNAADYGVPQKRLRAIVIGSRLGDPKLPTPTHGGAVVPYETVRHAFSTPTALPAEPDGRNWHRARNGIRPSSITRYRAVPAGGNRFDMQRELDRRNLGHLVPRCWREKPSGTTDVFGRLRWNEPSVTIRTEFFKPEKGRYLHPTEHRPITVREAARLQSFPDTFVFPEHQSLVSVARQIGNAVPPRLAQAIAQEVACHIADPTRSRHQLELLAV